jgi:hypothetical protein
VDKIFSGQRIDAVYHSASYGMSGREQVSDMLYIKFITKQLTREQMPVKKAL